MEGQSKYLLLQVWCGMLTVAMLVMAALLISIKPRSTEVSVTFTLIFTSPVALFTLQLCGFSGSSLSYIQLTKTLGKPSWQSPTPGCPSCSLDLRNNSIHCSKSSLYFIYAQVAFSNLEKSHTKSVILKKNQTFGRALKILVEGTFPPTTKGSVWVASVVSLSDGDTVSLDIKGDFLTHSWSTFWGAYELH
uniref:THD domain-containing protein n=1 Tax=Cyclopterus lumpus TaxID=8103 RepID=A0A8C2ZC09_CYCLU